MRLLTRSPGETEAAGRRLAAELEPGDLVLLGGDLAAGKTTLVRGLVEGLGGDPGEVSSPTFVLVQSYPVEAGPIRVLHHVDLYRLVEAEATAFREIGLEELLSDPGAVAAVEWPVELVTSWSPAGTRRWVIRITVLGDGSREILVETGTGEG